MIIDNKYKQQMVIENDSKQQNTHSKNKWIITHLHDYNIISLSKNINMQNNKMTDKYNKKLESFIENNKLDLDSDSIETFYLINKQLGKFDPCNSET